MDTLAPELIQRIFSHIHSGPDIANFRLVQRSFAELGTEYFFRSIDVKPTYRSLHRLLEISQNAEFAHHVKQVVLHLDDFRHSIWIPFTKRLKTDNLEDVTPDQKCKVLREIVEEFESFRKSPDYSGILSSAFRRLPRLESIQIIGKPSRKYGIDPQTSLDMGKHFMYEEECPVEGWWAYGNYLAFYSLVSAVYFGGVKLVSFRNNTDLPYIEDGFELYNLEELVRRAATAFRDCLVLELAYSQTDPRLLVDILAPTVRVERLGLKFGTMIYGDSFSRIFQREYVWSGLRELEMRTVYIDSADFESFLNFLQRHHATLRELVLWDCRLTTGSWAKLIICAKEALKLERLELESLSDTSKTYSKLELEGMVNYVLNPNSGELPPSLR